MATLFTLCAVIGGTVLLFQFVLSLLGLMDMGVDLADDIDIGGDTADIGHMSHDGHVGHVGHAAHSVAWLWSMFSFRTIIAGLTFFGLFGMAMRSSGASLSLQLSTAAIGGLAAFYGVHALMRGIMKLARDSTMQIKRTIGQTGTVYLTVPAAQSGTGKVHVTVQGRLEEFQASTPWPDRLSPGAKVVVIGVIDGDTLAVEPAEAHANPTPKLAGTTV